MYIYIRNTGDETVHVAFGDTRWLGFFHSSDGWSKVRSRGWYEVKPGQRQRIAIIDQWERAAFAFNKRGGYVRYDVSSTDRLERRMPTIAVQPGDAFDIRERAQGSQVTIPTSFEMALVGSGGGILHQTIEIQSLRSDQVTPFPSRTTSSKAPAPPKPKKEFTRSHTPEQAVYRFFTAIATGNEADARKYSDKWMSSAAELNIITGHKRDPEFYKHYQFISKDIDGRSGAVTLEYGGKRIKASVVIEDGEWMVSNLDEG